MPTLTQSLKGRDLSFLRAVAEHWGIELNAPDARQALSDLTDAMLDAGLVEEVHDSLPPGVQEALADLLRNDGRLPWSLFIQRYGEIRKMGEARRERLRPDRSPASPAESLWYHALVGQGFFESQAGQLVEFAYIPDDLVPLLPKPPALGPVPLGRPASPQERKVIRLADDRFLDNAATLLAGLRMGWGVDTFSVLAPGADLPAAKKTLAEIRASHLDMGFPGFPLPALLQFLQILGLLGEKLAPLPDPVRTFLETPRDRLLSTLVTTWRASPDFNELRLLPGFQAEGDWKNDPVRTRYAILGFLATLPDLTWWSLGSFLSAIKEQHPNYQRPEGNYDTFYLRDTASGEFVHGFENWERVDGALVGFMITCIMFGLGLIDLAAPAEDAPPSAFRKSRWYHSLLSGEPPSGMPEEKEKVHVSSDGRIGIPRLAPRSARYLIARFAEWQPAILDEYRYRLTPASLEEAGRQGLRIEHLVSLLARYSDGIPPNITQALKRFEKEGSQVQVQRVSILRLKSPELVQELRKSRARTYLGELIGPTTLLIKPGAEEKVLALLVEMGYLGELI